MISRRSALLLLAVFTPLSFAPVAAKAESTAGVSDVPQIIVKLTPFRDPRRDAIEDAEKDTAASELNQVPFQSRFVPELRQNALPRYRTSLRLWMLFPGVSSITSRSREGDRLLEMNPRDSAYAVTKNQQVIGLSLEQRTYSFPLHVRIGDDRLVERWLHVEVKLTHPIVYTATPCRDLGLRLEPYEDASLKGDFLYAALHCVLDPGLDATTSDDDRVFGLLSYSKDAELESRRFQAFAEMGSQYVLIDLLRLNPNEPVLLEIRRKETFSGARLRLKYRPELVVHPWIIRAGTGASHKTWNGGGTKQSVFSFDLDLELHRWPNRSPERAEWWFTFRASALPLSRSNDAAPKYRTMEGSAVFAFPLPLCPLAFFDLSCNVGIGGTAWSMQVSGEAYGISDLLYGPELRLIIRDQSPTDRTYHYAMVRFAPLLSSGREFDLGFALTEFRYAYDVSIESSSDKIYVVGTLGFHMSQETSLSAGLQFEL